MKAYVIPYTNVSYFQCKKDITVDYMEQCPEETNMAVSFTDLSIQQINKDQCAFNGKIEFLKPVGEPWKVNIILIKTVPVSP